jgi:hypothetical protein
VKPTPDIWIVVNGTEYYVERLLPSDSWLTWNTYNQGETFEPMTWVWTDADWDYFTEPDWAELTYGPKSLDDYLVDKAPVAPMGYEFRAVPLNAERLVEFGGEFRFSPPDEWWANRLAAVIPGDLGQLTTEGLDQAAEWLENPTKHDKHDKDTGYPYRMTVTN